MTKVELLSLTSKYVRHCEHVWLNSQTREKTGKLQIVDGLKQTIYHASKAAEYWTVCELIHSQRKELFQIAPNNNNPSYESSLNVYSQIVNACRVKLHLSTLKLTA